MRIYNTSKHYKETQKIIKDFVEDLYGAYSWDRLDRVITINSTLLEIGFREISSVSQLKNKLNDIDIDMISFKKFKNSNEINIEIVDITEIQYFKDKQLVVIITKKPDIINIELV